MHIADLAVESFVLEPSRRLGWSRQLGLDPHPGEGLDGSVPAPRLQHGLVLRACAERKETSAGGKNGGHTNQVSA